MKKFMKKLAKKSEGFTLVELIVVIAILGILAGVAVPAYNGYLTKAKEAADITTLDAIKTAAQAYSAETAAVSKVKVEASNGDISKITVTTTADKVVYDDVSTDKVSEDDFMLFLTGTASTEALTIKLDSDTYKSGANWDVTRTTDGGWAAGTT